MTGTERKRRWRELNPDRSSGYEQQRAQARRNGFWGDSVLGEAPRECRSSVSYARYEYSMKRLKQRMFWPRYGAGTTTMTREEFRAVGDAVYAAALAAENAR